MVDEKEIQRIFQHIPEDMSKQIYTDRLNYSLTGDYQFLDTMIDRTVRKRPEWRAFCETLAVKGTERNLVIFGAGIWGSILYRETNELVDWEYVVDSAPAGTNRTMGSKSVLSYEEFIKRYDGEYIVISSYKNYEGMYEQLKASSISDQRIINAGSVIYGLTEKATYFDLEGLRPCKEKEVFVDAGCFDGFTTRQFFEWCNGKGYSYCLEPDAKNIAAIKKNLAGYGNYEVINRALWAETTTLSMNARGNFATSVSKSYEEGNLHKTQAVALDDILLDKGVTFIKMDIEGAEVEALHGAARVISEQKPRLAISIYHKPEDIWTIPKTILDFCTDYKFYLRHYSFSDYDTVLYAVS